MVCRIIEGDRTAWAGLWIMCLGCLSWLYLYVDCMEKLTCICVCPRSTIIRLPFYNVEKINACEVNISLQESEVLSALYFDECVIKPAESCGF